MPADENRASSVPRASTFHKKNSIVTTGSRRGSSVAVRIVL